MNETFQSFYENLCEPKFFDLTKMLEILRPAGDFSDDLLTAMEARLEKKDWPCLCRLIWIACWFPSNKLTPLLCEVLENHRHDVLMEAVADALFDLQDERSITCLTTALEHRVSGDDDLHFNRKLVIALENIGTPAALIGLRKAAESPHELIRKEALAALRRLDTKS
jgi:hypothetical protein